MPLDRVSTALSAHVAGLEEKGTAKGAESVVRAVIKPRAQRGPRFLLEDEGEREFLRMNSNSYLGMGLREEIIAHGGKGCHQLRRRTWRRALHQRHV